MMKINWKVRLKNWRTVVATLITVLGVAWTAGGFTISDLDNWYVLWLSFVRFLNSPMAIITTIVAVVGILMDPTTSKFSDSLKVMNYSEPRKDDK